MKRVPLVLFAMLAAGASTQPFSCFPRMGRQPSVKPFERKMPALPQGLVPFGAPAPFPRDPRQAAKAANPVRPTPRAVLLGGIYYGYYCLMCHGERADGNGAVGQSYDPKPADLTSAKVQALPDGTLCLAMVTGPGHVSARGEPVLEPTVALERRWLVVHYLRTLAPSRRP